MKSSLQIFYGRINKLVDRYEVSIFKWQWLFSPFFLSPTKLLLDFYMVHHGLCLIRNRSCQTFASTSGHPVFYWLGVCFAHHFSFLCCVFLFVSVDFVLCLVCLMLPVSLDCLFLTVPSVFSNVAYISVLSFLDFPFGFLQCCLCTIREHLGSPLCFVWF